MLMNPMGGMPRGGSLWGGAPAVGSGGMRPMAPGGFRAAPIAGRPVLGSFKKGGKVKKTGLYKLHAGEKVTSLKQMMKGC